MRAGGGAALRLPRPFRTDCRAPMPEGMRVNGRPVCCTLGRWHRTARHVHASDVPIGNHLVLAEWETPPGADPITHQFEMTPIEVIRR